MIPADYNELTPPLINISLWMFFDKYCSGMENRACVAKPFASYLKEFDPEEKYLHIEPSEAKPLELFYVYPIKAWRESVERRRRLEQVSETSRQIRFALVAEQEAINGKIQRRRDILAEVTADVIKPTSPAYNKLRGQPREFVEYLCFKCLIGENKTGAKNLGISDEVIEEFKLLPVDPEWKNKFWNPVT